MEVQLQDLIEKIKSEGVKSAQDQSAEIISTAEEKAKKIIEEARQKADKLVADGKTEVARSEASSKEALKQASRDLLLNIQGKIKKLFDTLLEQELKSALKDDVLGTSIVELIKAWDKDEVKTLDVLLSEASLNATRDQLVSKLAQQIKSGLEIKPFPAIEAGFKVSQKDGSAYYDFTDQGLADMISQYLNPKLSEILKKSIEE